MSPGSKNRVGPGFQLKEKKPYLMLRANIIQSIRNFFVSKGFLEVETPTILKCPAPEYHIEPILTEYGVLRTSPELSMKMLVGAGYDKIFQICKCFRKGERGRMHLPEFTMLEWYTANSDYFDLMETCEALINSILKTIKKGDRLTYRGRMIDFSIPWERMSVADAFERYCGSDVIQAHRSGVFDQILVEKIEHCLGLPKPVFLYDYPACESAMAKLKPSDERFAERFELYIAGIEIGNGFSELVDPIQQRRQFEKVIEKRKKEGLPCWPLPERFLGVLDSLPPTAGIALGIDRLVMVLTDAEEIDEVVAFTQDEA